MKSDIANKTIRAVDLRRLSRLKFAQLKRRGGLQASALPTVDLDRGSLDPRNCAVVSWRWDCGGPDGFSLNLAAALCAAQKTKDYLFVDLISVAQDQHKSKLIEDVASLSELFSWLPVFAAYDQEGVADWKPAMRRPWLFFEGRAFYGNDQTIVYASHQRSQGGEDSFGFRHMLKRVWDTNYTTTVLLLLANPSGIGQLTDLAYIIPHHRELLTSAFLAFGRNDFLLTAAIVCQAFDDDGRFHTPSEDPTLNLENFSFDRYALTAADGADPVYNYFDILLDGEKVGTYYTRTKIDRFTSKPAYVRYLIVSDDNVAALYRIFHPPTLERFQADRIDILSSFSLKPKCTDNRCIKIARFYSR